jgi:hypothetical protein
MKKLLLLILIALSSSVALIAADHQEVFIGTGETHDDAERNAKDQASPHGGVSSIVSISTTKTGTNTWICVLKAMVSN